MKDIHIEYQVACSTDNMLGSLPDEATVQQWVTVTLETLFQQCSNNKNTALTEAVKAALPLHEYEQCQKPWENNLTILSDSELEICIRIVDDEESAALNSTWRHKDGPTNVLSFPADIPFDVTPKPLGDIVICAPVVFNEAQVQKKSDIAHWAHMVIHGLLHLLGYDHEEDTDAVIMESAEAFILNLIGFSNPYDDNTGS